MMILVLSNSNSNPSSISMTALCRTSLRSPRPPKTEIWLKPVRTISTRSPNAHRLTSSSTRKNKRDNWGRILYLLKSTKMVLKARQRSKQGSQLRCFTTYRIWRIWRKTLNSCLRRWKLKISELLSLNPLWLNCQNTITTYKTLEIKPRCSNKGKIPISLRSQKTSLG